jgi:short-subunit dehydrogenase
MIFCQPDPQKEGAMRKIAWVTGAGKGIGRATALLLARKGWHVAASARTEEDLVALQCEAAEGSIEIFPLDVTDLPATLEVVTKIGQKLGPIQLAILNAGTHKPFQALNFSVDNFRQLVETNVMGTVHGLASILPEFLERKSGHIAIVASVAGYRGLPSAAAYGCTKAGLINLAEALKPELDEAGIKLSLINPGFVKTPLTDQNDFPMPELITADAAADYIVRGLSSNKFEITFPWRFATLMRILRFCPDWIFFRITRRMVRTS